MPSISRALSRRSFLTALSAALPIAAVVRRAHALSVDALTSEHAPARTLHALGAVVLPSELGPAGISRVVEAFQRWIAGYREHVEVTHGYGSSRLRFTGPTPATRWAAQLDTFDSEARSRHGQPFALLTAAQRDALVRDAIGTERLDRMPSTADARHVAVALITFFYDSPEATDLCYEARIGRQTCRPLATSGDRPVQIPSRRV